MVSFGEKCLCIFAVLVVVVGIFMAAFVGFVLNDEYMKWHEETETPHVFGSAAVPQWNRDLQSSRTYKSINHYKWLVSITVPLFIDDSDSFVYACSGIVIKPNTVLTGKGCITSRKGLNKDDFIRATVRSNSEYYSYGGRTHKVVSHNFEETGNQFVELVVTPVFSEDMIVYMADSFNKDDELEAVGWGGLRVSFH